MLYRFYTNKTFFINMLEYITAFFIILQCNSLFMGQFHVNTLLHGSIILLFIFGLFNINKHHNNLSNLFLFLILFLCIMSVFLIFNFYIYHYPLKNIFIFLFDPMMLVVYFYSFIDKYNKIDKTIFFKIENIIVILATISLLIWILATIGIIQPNTYVTSDWSIKGQIIPGYYNFLYATQGNTEFLGLNLLRNSGIFTEAPMYSYVLIYALLIETFIKNKKLINYRTIILTLTIITTTSSSGVIIAILSLLFSYFTNKHKNKQFLILLFIIIIPIMILLFNVTIINRIGTVTDRSLSFIIRYDDILASLKTWNKHLIIGNGMDNINSIVQNMSSNRIILSNNMGLSTGFMSSLAYGGIILGLFYIIPTILVMKMKISSKLKGLAIFSFVLSTFTMISTVVLYILLLSYFWANIIYYKEVRDYSKNILFK